MLVQLENVLSVYSGKDGKCCCGCSGKHSYPSAYREEAGKVRGYEVDDDEVSDRQVKRVVNLINKNETQAQNEGDFVSLVVGARLYVAYLRK